MTPLRAVGASARGLLTYLAWSFVWGICLVVPRWAGVAWGVAVCVLFYSWYVARAARDPRRSATLRLRPPRVSWRRVLAAVPLFFVFSDSLSQLYSGLPFVHSDPGGMIDEFAGSLPGWVLGVLVVAVLAPVIEEFTFRGWVQRPLERCFGTPVGITCSSLVFAVSHWELQWLPVYAVLGAILGWTAVDTRSIWPGVVLHAGHNAGAVLSRLASPALGRPPEAGLDFGGGTGVVAALVLSSAALLYLGHPVYRQR